MPTSENLAKAASRISAVSTSVAFDTVVESTSGGFKFPDGTIQTTAARQPTKIAYIGDSLGGTPLWGKTLPSWLETMVRAGGVSVDVVNCGKDAMTFYRANTQADFGTKTAVQRAIAEAPDVVIVVLGVNDIIFNVDSRTPAQAEADAIALFASLRAGLPSAEIILFQEVIYDTATGHVSSGFANRHIIPALHNIPVSGPNADCRIGEILPLAIDGGVATNVANLTALYGNVIGAGAGAGTIDSAGLLDIFRPFFFGCHIGDGVHPDSVGAMFLANTIYKHLRAGIPRFAELKTNGQAAYHDFDALFAIGVSDAGTHYTPAGPAHNEVYRVGRALGEDLYTRINTWHLSLPLSITYNKLSVANTTADHYSYVIKGGLPGAALDLRLWPSAGAEPTSWTPTGVSFNTAGEASAIEHGSALGQSSGTYKVKYSTVGADGKRDVIGPLTITLT